MVARTGRALKKQLQGWEDIRETLLSAYSLAPKQLLEVGLKGFDAVSGLDVEKLDTEQLKGMAQLLKDVNEQMMAVANGQRRENKALKGQVRGFPVLAPPSRQRRRCLAPGCTTPHWAFLQSCPD